MTKAELKALLEANNVKPEDVKKILAAYKEPSSSGKVSGAINKQISGFKDLSEQVARVNFGLDKNLNIYQRILKSQQLYREELERFTKAGYSRQFQDFSKSIELATKTSLRLTGNIRAAEEALQGMKTGFKGFGLITSEARQDIIKLSTSLASAGYDMASFSKIVDSSTFAFGAGTGEIQQMTAQLVNLQQGLAIAPQELTKNFEYAQKNFAYSAGKIMENFAKLSKMSRETGLDFQKLAGSFGDSMDTFEGAAQMAGGLNQILGGSVFNSVELLTMDEATRAQTIRQRIQKRMTDRGLDVGQLGKFELKAIATRLNMNTEEARRFLRTGELKDAGEGAAKVKGFDDKMFREGTQKAGESASDLAFELDKLKQSLQDFRGPQEQMYMRMRESISDGLKRALNMTNYFSVGRTGEQNRRAAAGLDPLRLGAQTPDYDPTVGDITKGVPAVATATGDQIMSSLLLGGAKGGLAAMLARYGTKIPIIGKYVKALLFAQGLAGLGSLGVDLAGTEALFKGIDFSKSETPAAAQPGVPKPKQPVGTALGKSQLPAMITAPTANIGAQNTTVNAPGGINLSPETEQALRRFLDRVGKGDGAGAMDAILSIFGFGN